MVEGAVLSRDLLVLWNDDFRQRAIDRIKASPKDTRVTFAAPKRTLDQNSKMWAMLDDIADQKEHFGRKYPTNTWKILFLHALGRETEFVPALMVARSSLSASRRANCRSRKCRICWS